MKYTFTLLTALLLAPLSALHAADAPRLSKKPNVILILSDDLGWADLSCYGSTFHESPNLDKLAAQGIPKLMKSGERIVWFDYGTNLDQASVPRLLATMDKDIKVVVFPAVVEGVDWDMFRKKTEAGSTEPIHQRALNFDTDVDKKITGTDLYDVKITSARVWVMESKSVDKKLRGQTFDSYENLFSKIKTAGIRVGAYADAVVVRHFTHECLGNILEMPGVMMNP